MEAQDNGLVRDLGEQPWADPGQDRMSDDAMAEDLVAATLLAIGGYPGRSQDLYDITLAAARRGLFDGNILHKQFALHQDGWDDTRNAPLPATPGEDRPFGDYPVSALIAQLLEIVGPPLMEKHRGEVAAIRNIQWLRLFHLGAAGENRPRKRTLSFREACLHWHSILMRSPLSELTDFEKDCRRKEAEECWLNLKSRVKRLR